MCTETCGSRLADTYRKGRIPGRETLIMRSRFVTLYEGTTSASAWKRLCGAVGWIGMIYPWGR